MSIATNLLELATAEAAKRGCDRIVRIRVEYGSLSGIMPEALSFCFNALIADTPHKDALLELVCLPLQLRCPFCGATFGGENQNALWMECPHCGKASGHDVEQGRELILAQLEAVNTAS